MISSVLSMLFFFKILVTVAFILLVIVLIYNSHEKTKENDSISNAYDDDLDRDDDQSSEFFGNVSAKRILTDSEAYNLKRIIDNLPNGILICPQVSFNAFIDCKKMNLRNQFNRKSVDYLLVDLNYNPLLVVEVDDDSHSSKKVRMRDLQRDEIAAAAGIPTLRITNKTPTERLGSLIREHLQRAA